MRGVFTATLDQRHRITIKREVARILALKPGDTITVSVELINGHDLAIDSR